MSRRGWSTDLLHLLDLPDSVANRTFLAIWEHAEGGHAANNPLNTTLAWPGATNYNSAGVKNYPSDAAGLQATAQTLRSPRYAAILAAFRASDMKKAAAAVVASPWGTQPHPLLDLVGDAGGDAIPQGPTGGLATGAANAAVSSVKTIGDLIGALTSVQTWVRVLEVVGGLACVYYGGVLLLRTSALRAVSSAIPAAAAGKAVSAAPAAAAKVVEAAA